MIDAVIGGCSDETATA